ncbi:hypothetical protein [Membranihabitans maritimus]|uniref:hypothetical protein n=1 Tax=Membranihabitans maritimus TaxID=2904244 RepID=UPI001F46BB7D|nr:hypothetical protein [Membranihabitans maritimus]
MKINIIFLLLVTVGLYGQNDQEGYIEFSEKKVDAAETFSSGSGTHGVYLGIQPKFGKIGDDNALFFTGRLGYVTNNKLEIGISGSGFYSDHNLSNLNRRKVLTGAYGGLHFEPIFFGKQKVHMSVPVMIGGGAIGFLDRDDFDIDPYDDEWDPFFLVEPGVNVVFKISNIIQLETGITYRMTSDVLLGNQLNLENVNGLSFGVGLKMGVFNLGSRKMVKTNVSTE